jgi:type VI secretion system secreted protein VgrG
LPTLTNNQARFELAVDGSSETWNVVRWEATEGLSTLYQFRVTATTEGAVPPASLIGSKALLTVHGPDAPRLFHGIIAGVSEGGRGLRQNLVELTVVPREWRLLYAHDCRIFQQKTAQEIITSVLQQQGIAGEQVRMRLAGSYTPHEYCVQYRESDWAFISRLCEEEGIYYYFEHAENEHTVVFADRPQAHDPIDGDASVLLHDVTGQVESQEFIANFWCSARLGTDRVRLQDFNFVRPATDLGSDARGETPHALELYDYPGGHEDGGAGRKIAKIRLEEQVWPQQTAHARSNVVRMTPGRKFTLVDVDERLRDELRQDYVVLSVRHRGEQQAADADGARAALEYENEFDVLPLAVAYRPPRVTPRPIVQGVQTAIVVGPGGEEIYTDAHGRVKVQFHWDRLGSRNQNSSCWIRVSQAWAGEGWGFIAIPRIGHEVVVSFLEGDPDRPLITGRVYHGTNTPPYDLPGAATRTTLKSNSSPGGGGSNELRFEDAAGSEEVYLHGQKDWNILIENDKGQRVGHDETLNVGHDRTKTVGHDQRETVQHDKFINVTNEHTEDIGANCTITIGGHHVETVRASRNEDIAQDAVLDVGGNSTTEVRGNMSLTVLQNKEESVLIASNESVGAAKAVEVGGAYAVTVGAAYSRNVVGSSSVSAGGSLSESTRANMSLSANGNTSVSADGDVTVHSGKGTAVSADGTVGLTAKKDMTLNSDKKVTITAANEVKIQCGDATVTLKKNGEIVVKGGKIKVEGSGNVVIKGSKVGVN